MKRIIQWIVAIMGLLAALGSLSQGNIVEGTFALLFGLFILPPIHWNLKQKFQQKLSPGISYTIAILLFLGFAVIGISRTSKEQEKEDLRVAAEKSHQDSLDALKQEEEKKEAKAKSEFLEAYQYVSSDAYDKWMDHNKDSGTDLNFKMENFLRQQEKYSDSLTQALRLDSIKRVKEERRIAQEHRQDSLREARRLQRQLPQTEYYNGHEVLTGPRGGRYYINDKGKQVYLKK